MIRTILSQNTTSHNSTLAKDALDAEYGRANWSGVLAKSLTNLQETVSIAGLGKKKGSWIMELLETLEGRDGLNMDHLKDLSDDDAMAELLSFKGVG